MYALDTVAQAWDYIPDEIKDRWQDLSSDTRVMILLAVSGILIFLALSHRASDARTVVLSVVALISLAFAALLVFGVK